MWRLTALESPAMFNNTDPPVVPNIVSVTRTVPCLVSFVFIIIFTAILTIATLFEHFTNICIGLLSILMMFFVVYSITAIRSFLKQEIDTTVNMNDNIWTTVSDLINIRETDDRISKNPPSYESVTRDSEYTLSPPPPPYSTVIGDGRIGIDNTSFSCEQTSKINSDQVVIDVTSLPQTCSKCMANV